MRLSKAVLVSMAAALLLSLSVEARNEMRKAYMFGVAQSFNDSVVYFTDIQEVDSAWFTGKKHFLVSRENYSYQLRDFLGSIGQENRTCIVVYDFDKKKIEKKWNKLNNRYSHKSKATRNNDKRKDVKPPYQIKNLVTEEFMFQPIAANEEDEFEEKVEKPKKQKKAKPGKGEMPAPPPGGAPDGAGAPPMR